MNFLELARQRYSVRNYRDDLVPREALDRCIEAARLAPSACNSQPWKFVVMDDPALKARLAAAAFEGLLGLNHFAFKAPVLVVIVAERQKAAAKWGGLVKRKNFSQMDIAIAAEHFCLQAAAEGLGTCMLGWFNEANVKKQLAVGPRKRIELLISVGFSADEQAPRKKRKTTEEMAAYNQYR
jgi:nitroreductase